MALSHCRRVISRSIVSLFVVEHRLGVPCAVLRVRVGRNVHVLDPERVSPHREDYVVLQNTKLTFDKGQAQSGYFCTRSSGVHTDSIASPRGAAILGLTVRNRQSRRDSSRTRATITADASPTHCDLSSVAGSEKANVRFTHELTQADILLWQSGKYAVSIGLEQEKQRHVRWQASNTTLSRHRGLPALVASGRWS